MGGIFMERIKGSNSHGNKNEDNIVSAINGLNGEGNIYKDLNLNLKTFVAEICSGREIKLNSETLIRAKKETNNHVKPDFYIYIENNEIAVSCKMGRSNSVHQEKIEGFCTYIKDQLNASDEICDSFKFYIWSDGTTDGSGNMSKDSNGNIISRMTGREFKKNFPEKRRMLLKFVKENQANLLERFIFSGVHGQVVDYVYHGTEENAVWLSREEVIQYNINNSKLDNENPIAVLPCGRTTLQSWNISKNGKNEHKRGEIQAKYGDMKKDFSILMNSKATNLGTFYGNQTEYDLSKSLNYNQDRSLWKELLVAEDDYSNNYVVKVDSKQPSKLTGKKVNTKADAYIIKSNIDKNFLLKHDYTLTEKTLEGLDYKVIDGTGISIKREDSKNYTYQKFTRNSFKSVFENYLEIPDYYFAGILLFVTEKELFKNDKILMDLEINKELFLEYFNNKDLNIIYDNDLNNSVLIKKFSQEVVKELVEENIKLSDLIFKGKYNFDEPYVANYIYSRGELKKVKAEPFYITTGSGRSKGIYTIIFKPV